MSHRKAWTALLAVFCATTVLSRPASAAPAAGLDVVVDNRTPYDILLHGSETVGGTFATAPTDLKKGITRTRFVATPGADEVLIYSLDYEIPKVGANFQASLYQPLEGARKEAGSRSFLFEKSPQAKFKVEVNPPYDPKKSYQEIKVTISPSSKIDAIGSEAMRMIGSLRNATQFNVTKAKDSLEWGKWETSPAGTITKGSIDDFEAWGRAGSATGTEGYIRWDLKSANGATMTLSWNVPYIGANQYAVDFDGPDAGSFKFNCSEEHQDRSGYLKLSCRIDPI